MNTQATLREKVMEAKKPYIRKEKDGWCFYSDVCYVDINLSIKAAEFVNKLNGRDIYRAANEVKRIYGTCT